MSHPLPPKQAKDRTVVLAGAGGFVGSAIEKRFRERILNRLRPIGSHDGDLTDRDSTERLFKKIETDSVFVFCAGIPRRRSDSIESMMQNIAMASNVARQVAAGKISHLIFFSSVDVYGRETVTTPILETTPENPDTWYGVAKLASENLLRVACRRAKAALTILRLPGIYGCEPGGRDLIGKLIDSAVGQRTFHLEGEGVIRRDLVFVHDIPELVRQVIESRVTGIFNVATGISLSIREMIAFVEKAGACKIPIVQKAPASPAVDLVFDITKLRSTLPTLSLRGMREGIALAYRRRTAEPSTGGAV